MRTDYFLNQSRASLWARILALVGLMFGGLLVLSIPGLMLSEKILADADVARAMQCVSSVFLFVLPAMAYVRLFGGRIGPGLFWNRVSDSRIWLPVFMSMLLLQPAINLLGHFNEQMIFPEFMAPLESWMRKIEDSAREQTMRFFDDTSLPAVAANMFAMAVIAGFTEEVFFRGALMHVLSGKEPAGHAAIWITAALFSAFHMQFYGFLPRMLMGAYFGYLVCWSRSLWPAVLAHFANNAMIVVLMSITSIRDLSVATGEITKEEIWLYVLATVLTLPLFVCCVRYVYKLRATDKPTFQSSP